jgi:ADP-ribose pyrophosphatase YjhB (NUDIX family)
MIVQKTAAVVVERKSDGKIILLKRPQTQSNPGEWVIPGGHVEEGEPVNITALREMKEEIGGVDDDSLEQVGMPFMHDVLGPKTGPHQHICQAFRATKSDEPVIDQTEADDWAWFNSDEITRLKLTDWTERVLKELSIIK